MRSLVMSDIETNTEWAHLLGRAMSGPLKGKVLKPVVADMVTWEVWQSSYPDTTVMSMPARRSEYTSKFYRDPDRFVMGIIVRGEPWHAEYSDLKEQAIYSTTLEQHPLLLAFDAKGAVPRVFSRILNQKPLVFKKQGVLRVKDENTGSVWDLRTGEAISGPLRGSRLRQWVGIMSFKNAWQNFHPDSRRIKYAPQP